ncbi:MAG: heme exporter protein CcmB [Peptococcaceae bacterium]
MQLVRNIYAIVLKDIRAELRGKEILSSMLFFSLLIVVIMNFTLDMNKDILGDNFPGLIWIVFLFTGVLGINRSFINERTNDCYLGINLAVGESAVILLSKALSNLVFIIMVQLIVIPMFFLFFSLKFPQNMAAFLLINFLGTAGFVFLGTFLSALTINNNSEILLPIVLFPLITPLVLAVIQASNLILKGTSFQLWGHWLGLVFVFDFLYTVVPVLLFDFLVEV